MNDFDVNFVNYLCSYFILEWILKYIFKFKAWPIITINISLQYRNKINISTIVLSDISLGFLMPECFMEQ